MKAFVRTALRLLAIGVFAIQPLAQNAGAQTTHGSTNEAATNLRQMVEALSATGRLDIEQRSIRAAPLIERFYESRRFQPAWTSAKNAQALIAAIESAPADGLTPDDFHLAALNRLRSPDGLTPERVARRDLLFTSALIRLGYQLYYGKVNPASLDADWNLERRLFERDPVDVVAGALKDEAIPALFESARPQTPGYAKLRMALAKERAAASERDQVRVPDGPTLRKGDSGARVTALRARLRIGASTDFDDDLDAAVRAFQSRNRLTVDGVVGRATIAALNVGPAERIRTLRANLERARWLRDLRETGDFLAVNIAGFRVYLVRDGKIAWQTRAIVGKTYHKTPVFTADMQYIVLNPTWTPTVRIVRNEMLPRIRKDPGYLPARNFAVYDSAGRVVDPYKVNWSGRPKYRIVQRPGPKNALGQVKFIFPNKHAVYLHDTPSRNLFGETRRAFSHGCIRTENPIELAKLLLANQPDWQPEAIDAALASGKTKTVHLSKPMPVYLLYWTADPTRPGEDIAYLPDVYKRDGAVLKALDAPFRQRAN